jgi:hypothetical protein
MQHAKQVRLLCIKRVIYFNVKEHAVSSFFQDYSRHID